MSLGLFRCLAKDDVIERRKKTSNLRRISIEEFQSSRGSVPQCQVSSDDPKAELHHAKHRSFPLESHSTSSRQGKRSLNIGRNFCFSSDRRVLHDGVMYSSSRVELAATLHHVQLNERMLVGGRFEEGSYFAGFQHSIDSLIY